MANKSIDIIEYARSYYLLSNDRKGNKPVYVGGRVKLEYALQDVPADMIIATSGNDKRCVILIDYTTEECLHLAMLGSQRILKLKVVN